MIERDVEELFMQLTGETEDNISFWRPLCGMAVQAMNRRLAGCTPEACGPFEEQIRMAAAALAAVYEQQALQGAQPESFTAGELRVQYGGQAQAAAVFYRSCMEALTPLLGDVCDTFRQVSV